MYYDQVAQVLVPDWSRNRVTLLGDACQAVSLIAGQGASLAIAGAFLLGELLANEQSIERALQCYQQLWMPYVTEKQRVGRRDAQWFLPSSPLQLWLRRFVIGASSVRGFDTLFGAALVGKPSVAIRQLASDNLRQRH